MHILHTPKTRSQINFQAVFMSIIYCCLWTSLPPINLELSTAALKYQFVDIFWSMSSLVYILTVVLIMLCVHVQVITCPN